MLHIDYVKENQKQPLKYKYMHRFDAEIARRHFLRTMHWLAVSAIIVFLVFAPAGLQIHHLARFHFLSKLITW